MKPITTPEARSTVTRRRLLAGVGATAVGGAGLLAISSEPVRAQVTMGSFTLTGDSAELNDPPTSITATATGEYVVTASTVPDRVDKILQLRVGPEPLVDSVVTEADFETKSGTINLSGDVYSHKDISRGYFMPEEGATKTTAVTARLVVRVVVDGVLKSESWVEDSAPITIDHTGMVVEVGGSGSMTING